MYKTLSRFMQDTGIGSAGDGRQKVKNRYLIIYFRVRKDNCGRERVFRYVKILETVEKTDRVFERAQKIFDELNEPLKLLVANGKIAMIYGDKALAERWRETRKGINKNVDPYLDVGYGLRESRSKHYKPGRLAAD